MWVVTKRNVDPRAIVKDLDIIKSALTKSPTLAKYIPLGKFWTKDEEGDDDEDIASFSSPSVYGLCAQISKKMRKKSKLQVQESAGY